MKQRVKRILKALFPLIWLKMAFLIYNKLRIKTVDRFLFPAYKFSREAYLIQRDEKVYDQLNINEEGFSKDIQERLKLWHGWTQDEYLLVFDKPCLIEPRQGWAWAEGRLVYPSLGFSRAAYVHKPDYLGLHSSGKKVIAVQEVISLRDTGEENYFHFYNDVLAKLCFLEEKLCLSVDIPVLVSEKLYCKPFFQYFLKHSSMLKNRQWIIQTDFYLKAQKTYFCKPLTHTRAYLDKLVRSLPDENIPPAHGGRIFLNRHPQRLRYIENMEEVQQLCRQHNIEVVDAEKLSLQQQICLFRHASLLVGIHGAGMTNMIYGKNSIQQVVEIFPPIDYVPFHYLMLARLYGYQYEAVLGRKGKDFSKGGFVLDVSALDNLLSRPAKAEVSTDMCRRSYLNEE